MTLPSCGLYRTTAELEGIPEGRLVYFHNHGDPGPGLYLPDHWHDNRAHFQDRGTTLTDEGDAQKLEPVLAEGLYRVKGEFTCCEKNCRTYEVGLLTQLGYNGEATPILFVPEWTHQGLAFPTVGQPLDESRLGLLEPLKVAHRHEGGGKGGASELH